MCVFEFIELPQSYLYKDERKREKKIKNWQRVANKKITEWIITDCNKSYVKKLNELVI